jgi:hypothetical protein
MTRVADGFQLPLERENVFQPPKKKEGREQMSEDRGQKKRLSDRQ